MDNTASLPHVVETPIEVQPTSISPSAKMLIDGPKKRRAKKNHTDAEINPARYESIHEYLEEFYAQCATQAPRRGYDQHWNSKGFIHAGPALRLPNRGAANMICFLIDVLTDRIVNSSSPDVAKDALAFYNICQEFMQKRIEERRKEYARDILAAAAAIVEGKKN
jgi:hypothetical protein